MKHLVLLSRVAFALALIFTLAVALTPAHDHPLHLLPWEKGDHCVAFYVLAILGALAAPRMPLAALAAALGLFGGLIELLQALPAVNRDPRSADVVIDVAATLVALLPMTVVRWRTAAAARPDALVRERPAE